MDTSSGAMGPAQRFDRIEAVLERIEHKLDLKVNRDELDPIYQRLRAVEEGSTPLGRLYLSRFEDYARRVDQIEDLGSRQAREAVAELKELQRKVDDLDREGANRTAIVRDSNDRSQKRYQNLSAMVGVVTVINTILVFVVR